MLFQKLVSSLLYCHPKLAAVFADFSEESLKCGPIRGEKKCYKQWYEASSNNITSIKPLSHF